jgi:hypothetical protein
MRSRHHIEERCAVVEVDAGSEAAALEGDERDLLLRPTGALMREQDPQPFLYHFAEGVVCPRGHSLGLAHEMIVDAKSYSHQEKDAPEASRCQSVMT